MKRPFTIYDLRFTIWKKSVASAAVNRQSSIINHKFRRAFTLIELLAVISILGILAALTVPALKNFSKSDVTISASRQLLDGVARARQLAISQRTTVYMVFIPTNFWGNLNYNPAAVSTAWLASLNNPQDAVAMTNLVDKQLSGYNFLAYGGLGDQPGRHAWHYLAPWQTLPDGAFIAAQKFASFPGALISSTASPLFPQWDIDYPHADGNRVYAFTNPVAIPFPTADVTVLLTMPCIGFNYLGQLTLDGVNPAGRDEYIPLASGSVLPAINPNTKALQLGNPDVAEIPPGNSTNIAYKIVHIDWLTGRAVLESHKIGP